MRDTSLAGRSCFWKVVAPFTRINRISDLIWRVDFDGEDCFSFWVSLKLNFLSTIGHDVMISRDHWSSHAISIDGTVSAPACLHRWTAPGSSWFVSHRQLNATKINIASSIWYHHGRVRTEDPYADTAPMQIKTLILHGQTTSGRIMKVEAAHERYCAVVSKLTDGKVDERGRVYLREHSREVSSQGHERSWICTDVVKLPDVKIPNSKLPPTTCTPPGSTGDLITFHRC